MENTATSRVTIIAGYLKAPILGLVSGKDNRPRCPIKECRGELFKFQDIEPTDLGQSQFQCAKCRKTYLGMTAESVSKNVKAGEKELSNWRVRVKAEQLKGFEKLKLTDDEKIKVQRWQRGEIIIG